MKQYFCFYFVMPRGLWDLSSPAKVQTLATQQGQC